MVSQNFKASNLEEQPRKIDLRFLQLAFSSVTCRSMCSSNRADTVAYQNRNVRRLSSILGQKFAQENARACLFRNTNTSWETSANRYHRNRSCIR